jgi:two-component system CheB/CheR fusion protein
MLQLLFDDEGHRTLVAADGHKALELADQGSTVLDLIIADYNLPKGLSGLETSQGCKGGPSTQSPPLS